MKMTGKTTTLTCEEATVLAQWLEFRANKEKGGHEYNAVDPDLLTCLASCLTAGHTIKVSGK